MTDMSAKIWLRNLVRGIIKQAVRDVAQGNEGAEKWVSRNDFKNDCAVADYPDELRGALRDAVLLSRIERQEACREILELISTLESTERPNGNAT